MKKWSDSDVTKESRRIQSFTAASSVPLKLFLNRDFVESVVNRKFIIPYHIQLNPTAKCYPDGCPWCSCLNRDRSKELTYDEIIETFRLAISYGARATTITGDGDPLCHPKISDIVADINKMGVDVGIVNNGWLIHCLSPEALDRTTWMRISLGDLQAPKPETWWEHVESVVMDFPAIDYSFSYVLTRYPDIQLIEKMIRFASEHIFTHIRIVSNLLEADQLAETMEKTRKKVKKHVDDSLVIWQSRSEWTRGTKNCYLSLAKPVLGSDGLWYCCCGCQYLDKVPARKYVYPMSKLRCAEGLKDIIENQRWFNGSICYRCYYGNYNYFLGVLMDGIKHTSFI